MSFVLSDDGKLINLDHVETITPQSGNDKWSMMNASGVVIGTLSGIPRHVADRLRHCDQHGYDPKALG